MDGGRGGFNPGQQNYPDQQDFNSQKKKYSKGVKIGLFFTFLFLIILIIFLLWLFLNPNYSTIYSVSEESLTLGTSLNLQKGDVIKAEFEDLKYHVKVENLDENSISFFVVNSSFGSNMDLGESKKIDLDGDGVADIDFVLESILKDEADVSIKKIEKPGDCEENWVCTGWGECINGAQIRVCDDANKCGTEFDKPETQRDCVLEQGNLINEIYCENWGCFINASEDCSPSNFTDTSSFVLIGANVTTTTFYRINGPINGECNFTSLTKEQHIEYTDDLIQSLLDQNYTMEEIEDLEANANEQSDSLEGTFTYCKVGEDKLNQALINWSQGNLSSSDLEEECETILPLHDHPNCKIQLSVTEMSLLEGLSTEMSATGFNNASEISWISMNETIASLNPSVGETVIIYANQKGSTNITVTDNSIGSDCNYTMKFTVS